MDEGKGRLVWFGLDPRNSDIVIAIRNIRLIDHSFTKAGYIMVQIEKSYFQLTDEVDSSQAETRELMRLFDEAGRQISSDFSVNVNANKILDHGGEKVEVGGEDYIVIQKQSKATGWRLVILTPVDYTTEGYLSFVQRSSYPVLLAVYCFSSFTFILSTMITSTILNLIK